MLRLISAMTLVLLMVPAMVEAARPKPGEAIGTINIPRLGIKLPVVEGKAGAVPGPLPVHYETTNLPGEGQTVAIAAHRTTQGAPFRNLDHLKPNDAIFIKMAPKFGGRTYRYRVTGPRQFGCMGSDRDCASATAGFTRMKVTKLILTTCDKRGSERLFVYAFPAKK